MKHRPFARGVEHLMYVGDDDAVEKVTAPTAGGVDVATALVSGVIALETRGATRMVMAGIATYFGWKALRRR